MTVTVISILLPFHHSGITQITIINGAVSPNETPRFFSIFLLEMLIVYRITPVPTPCKSVLGKKPVRKIIIIYDMRHVCGTPIVDIGL